MTAVHRSFLLVGLGVGLMSAAGVLWLQVKLQQAVQVPSSPAPITQQATPKPEPAPAVGTPGGQVAVPPATPPASTPTPPPRAVQPITFVVSPGQDFTTVAKGLQQAGLVVDVNAFVAKVVANGWASRLQVGTYQLTVGTPEDAILQELITVK